MSDPRLPGGETIQQWAHDVLVAMGKPATQQNVQAFVTWANTESGGYNPNAAGGRYNPLNTTEGAMGFSGQGGSQGNIKDFASYDQGVRAQAYNLTHTKGAGYEQILAALDKGNDPQAVYSAVNASAFGTHNLGAGSGGSGASGGGGMAGGVSATAVANPAGTKFKVPKGGTLYAVDGTYVVVYKVGGDLIYYDFSEPGISDRIDMNGLPFGGTMTHQAFYAQQGLVHAGVASELAGKDIQSAHDYNSWISDKLQILTGGDKTMLADPGVVSILIQGAEKGWSPEEINAKLQTTTWWKTRTDTQRGWSKLSPAEQQQRINEAAAQLQDSWFQQVGAPIDPNDSRLKDWATKIASGAASINQATWGWIRPEAEKNDQSPWMRQQEQEKEAERQQGVDVGNMTGHVNDLFNNYGMQPSELSKQRWATNIVTKKKSEQDLVNALTQQASVLYPWAADQLKTGMTIKDVSQPWVDTYNRVMEQSTDLFNPKVQAALTQGQPIYDFEKSLKQSDGWLNTENARDTLTTAASTIGQKMGFLK